MGESWNTTGFYSITINITEWWGKGAKRGKGQIYSSDETNTNYGLPIVTKYTVWRIELVIHLHW